MAKEIKKQVRLVQGKVCPTENQHVFVLEPTASKPWISNSVLTIITLFKTIM